MSISTGAHWGGVKQIDVSAASNIYSLGFCIQLLLRCHACEQSLAYIAPSAIWSAEVEYSLMLDMYLLSIAPLISKGRFTVLQAVPPVYYIAVAAISHTTLVLALATTPAAPTWQPF